MRHSRRQLSRRRGTAEPRAEDVPIPDGNEVLVLKAKAKEGKGAKEWSPKTFDNKECKAFDQSDATVLAAWRDREAYEEVTEQETTKLVHEKPGRIIPGRARVVRTNKSDNPENK